MLTTDIPFFVLSIQTFSSSVFHANLLQFKKQTGIATKKTRTQNSIIINYTILIAKKNL